MTALWGSAAFQWNNHNLVPWSQDFDEWTPIGSPDVDVGEDDPFGGTQGYLLEDDQGGSNEYISTPVTFSTNGQKAVTLFIKEGDSAPTAGSQFSIVDTTAVVNRLQINLTWAAGVPQLVYSFGTKIWIREWLDGWYRLAILSTSVTAANNHEMRLVPALTTAQTGDVRFFGTTVLDVAIAGGYVVTNGAAKAYDGSSAQQHLLRVPFQKMVLGGSIWRSVRESADQHVREVVTVGPGVREIQGRVRYDENPGELDDMLRAGAAGYPLVYIPDTTDLDDAYEVEMLQPGTPWMQGMDVDWPVFREPTVTMRLRRMDGGSLAGMVA